LVSGNYDQLSSLGLENLIFSDVETGFRSGLYRNKDTGEYSLAFAGTVGNVFGPDWVNNFTQLNGNSTQYGLAIANSLAISSAIKNQVNGRLSFTGHSLGGGLAAISKLAAYTNGVSTPYSTTTTFNSAGLSQATLGAVGISDNSFTFDVRIDNFAVANDVLSTLQANSALPSAAGNTTVINLPSNSRLNTFQRHQTQAVRRALINEGYRH